MTLPHRKKQLTYQIERLLENFSNNAALLGQQIRPYSPERGASGLASLPEERAEAVIRNLTVCVNATEYALSQPNKNASVFLWRTLKSFGFQAPEDFFEKLEEDSCIEVYDHNGVWIFGNIPFYGITSYTLADLYEFPWHTLWRRGELDQARTYALGTRLLSNQVKECLIRPLPTHVVREESLVPGVEPELGMELELSPLLVAPLHTRGGRGVAGFVHSFRTNWIRTTRTALPDADQSPAHVESPIPLHSRRPTSS